MGYYGAAWEAKMLSLFQFDALSRHINCKLVNHVLNSTDSHVVQKN